MVVTAHRLAAEEYYALPPTERFTELIDGEVVVNQPRLLHQRVSLEICRLLANWCRAEPARGEAGIPVDVELDDHNVYAPDVWWVPDDRRPAADALRIVGPPHLAVEVRSPGTWRYDVGVKKAVYEREGLPELWLVDTTSRSVLVYRRSSPASTDFDVALELAEADVLSSPMLPGFEVSVAEIFPGGYAPGSSAATIL